MLIPEFCEGFDHESDPLEIPAKVSAASTSSTLGNLSFSTATPTGVGRCLSFSGYGANLHYVLSPQKTRVVSFHMNITANNTVLLTFMDGSARQVQAVVVGQQVQFRSGALSSTPTSGTVLLTTAVLSVGWHYLNLGCSIDSVAGAVTIQVDNVGPLRAGGLNTQSSANAYATVLDMSNNAGYNLTIDNLSVDYGTLPNVLSETLPPYTEVTTSAVTADGAETDLAPSAGARYQCVDSIPFSDSANISTGTAGASGTFQHAAIAGAGVLQVQVTNRAKVSGGGALLAAVMRIAGVDYPGPNTSLTVSAGDQTIFRTNTRPDTGLAFAIADVNAMEIGTTVALIQ